MELFSFQDHLRRSSHLDHLHGVGVLCEHRVCELLLLLEAYHLRDGGCRRGRYNLYHLMIHNVLHTYNRAYDYFLYLAIGLNSERRETLSNPIYLFLYGV